MQRVILIVVAASSIMLTGNAAFSQQCIFPTRNDESFKKAMSGFHEVMSGLVHGPAEQGDFTEVRERAGELAKLRQAVMAAALPEKLSGRCAEISNLAMEMSKAVDELESQSRANAGNDAMKTGLDRVHTAYRDLNGALTTLQDLLSTFHELMHPLWHDAYPNKDAAAIKNEIPKLKVRAKLILSTAEASEKSRAAGARALLEAVTLLEEAAAANDDASILEALRITHDAYEKLAEGSH